MLLNTSKSKHEGIERLLDCEHLAICELLFATPCPCDIRGMTRHGTASCGLICYGMTCRGMNGLLCDGLLWVSTTCPKATKLAPTHTMMMKTRGI